MSESQTPRCVLRSTAAVLAGMFAIIILSIGTDAALFASGVYPPRSQRMADSYFLVATAYRVLYTIAGAYLTARLAPDRPMRLALILGVIGLALGLVGALATWNDPALGPRWYSIAIFVIAMPCAYAGAALLILQVRARARADSRP